MHVSYDLVKDAMGLVSGWCCGAPCPSEDDESLAAANGTVVDARKAEAAAIEAAVPGEIEALSNIVETA